MNFLLANDDGINAEGISILAEILLERGNVYIVAPDGERSSNSHCLTLWDPVTVRIENSSRPMAIDENKRHGHVLRAFSTDGTPADCIKLGLEILRRKDVFIDYVVTGINHGPNLGTDTMYSGTVAAATEGVLQGVPALAVSYDSREMRYTETMREYILRTLNIMAEHNSEMDSEESRVFRAPLLSLNIPDIPVEKVKGLKICSTGERTYEEVFTEKVIDEYTSSYTYEGHPADLEGDENTDIYALKAGYATLAAIDFRFTCSKLNEKMKGWVK